MTRTIHVLYLESEDKFVAFTSSIQANQFAQGRSGVRGYVVQLDPPIDWLYRIRFHTGYKGFFDVEIDRKQPYLVSSVEGIEVDYSDWLVTVKAKNDTEAIQQALGKIVLQLGSLAMKSEDEDDEQ